MHLVDYIYHFQSVTPKCFTEIASVENSCYFEEKKDRMKKVQAGNFCQEL